MILITAVTNVAELAQSGTYGSITLVISNAISTSINAFFPTNISFPTNTVANLFTVAGTNYEVAIPGYYQASFSLSKNPFGSTWGSIIGNGGVYNP
jgi:hypothetical protein